MEWGQDWREMIEGHVGDVNQWWRGQGLGPWTSLFLMEAGTGRVGNYIGKEFTR